jgi:hypothetical protein
MKRRVLIILTKEHRRGLDEMLSLPTTVVSPTPMTLTISLLTTPALSVCTIHINFPVYDINSTSGIPSHEIPLQFTHRANKPLKENFTDCIEWLIHNKVDPDFPDRNDERYRHAFNKVDDEARGYALSTFLSSSWTPQFTAAIKARPLLETRDVEEGEGVTAEGVPKCDACNRKKHPPKRALSFRGNPYIRKTLSDVEQDSDVDSDDSDAIEIDEDGNDLEPTKREWFTGRYVFSAFQYSFSIIGVRRSDCQ